MSGIIDRRTLLMRGLGLGALTLGGGFLLEACSSGTKAASGSSGATSAGPASSAAGSGSASGSASVAPGAYGDLKFRLDWIKHVEFAGDRQHRVPDCLGVEPPGWEKGERCFVYPLRVPRSARTPPSTSGQTIPAPMRWTLRRKSIQPAPLLRQGRAHCALQASPA